MSLLARTLDRHQLVTDEGRAVLDVVERYTRAWRLLLQYDEKQLPESPSRLRRPSRALDLGGARSAIRELRGAAASGGREAGLFGQERGEQLAAILGNVEQTFGGEPLYPSVQARAANLLYARQKDLMIRLILNLLENEDAPAANVPKAGRSIPEAGTRPRGSLR